MRRAISTPGDLGDMPRRSPGGIFTSVVIHVFVILVMARMVIVGPRELDSLLGTKARPLPVERIGFLALPRNDKKPAVAGRSGGDNRPIKAAPSENPPPVVAPIEVPSAIAPPGKAAPTPDAGGSGEAVGNGGATRGIRPSFSDPRVWAPPAPIVVAPKSPIQRLDSAVAAIIGAAEDSLARLPHERAPGDWTWTRNGKKYGIDGSLIHLGDFSLPTALLALMPLNATGNPSGMERDRRLNVMRGEIQAQAARALRDDDFDRAVKALRERKQKERADQKKAAAQPPVPVVIP